MPLFEQFLALGRTCNYSRVPKQKDLKGPLRTRTEAKQNKREMDAVISTFRYDNIQYWRWGFSFFLQNVYAKDIKDSLILREYQPFYDYSMPRCWGNQLYYTKYSYQIQIIRTWLYSFMYSNLIIIWIIDIWFQVIILFNDSKLYA